MKTTILALVFAVSTTCVAQESGKAVQTQGVLTPAYVTAPKPSDPDYIGEVHHSKSHKLRNILIGTGIAAGVGAAIVLSHSGQAASHGSSGQFPSVPFTPVKAVQK